MFLSVERGLFCTRPTPQNEDVTPYELESDIKLEPRFNVLRVMESPVALLNVNVDITTVETFI
jgi:hypothetical protein